MNFNKIIVVLIGLIAGIFIATAGSYAAPPNKCSPWPACKDDGGDPPPPPPPPTGCMDSFPGFLYEVEATRKAPAELHLASSDACRSERIAIVPEFRAKAFHMTADESKGVILWSEDIENQYIVRRLDFTVNFTDDPKGDLILEGPVTILPLPGEKAKSGDYLRYSSMDIWGDATHESLYLTIRERRVFNSGPNAGTGTRVALIYDLNDLTDVTSTPDTREIYNEDAGGWQDANGLDCPSDPDIVPYPQYFPTCYRPQGIRFNPSGTRLYFEDNINDRQGQRWDAALRMNIGRVDLLGDPLPLDKWTFSAPELVYTGSGDQTAGGMLARPSGNPYIAPSEEEPSSAEYIAIRHTDRTGKNTLRTGDLLDADTCVDKYVIYADGTNNSPGNFLWGECLDTGKFFAAFNHGGGDSWQSPEALLTSTLGNRGFYDIYRRYVTGGSAGTEELLIEHARGADNGF